MKLWILIILILLIIPDVSATIIQGKVYDLELNRLNNVVVEIDTIPRQRVISQQGEYFLNVPKGEYTITARASIDGIIYSANENISVINEGEYTIDLFLFPEIKDIPEINGDDEDNSRFLIYGIIFVIFVLVILFIFKRTKIKNKAMSVDLDDDLKNIYNLIKKEKRITQKEIRKNSALSEAKISLIISQLEKEQKIQKIKKGRANIIILKQ